MTAGRPHNQWRLRTWRFDFLLSTTPAGCVPPADRAGPASQRQGSPWPRQQYLLTEQPFVAVPVHQLVPGVGLEAAAGVSDAERPGQYAGHAGREPGRSGGRASWMRTEGELEDVRCPAAAKTSERTGQQSRSTNCPALIHPRCCCLIHVARGFRASLAVPTCRGVGLVYYR